ncbi:glutathione S-transferase-like protein 1 [Elsinoe australis]|uniref:Glutathione S-transferase-like protein 1 n=1 Tax=Elsinoe australis TaxID=40998 RepID=A0A4U7BER9_9PEZI|nr:glutathione S-transferase-like protein 1 [Elsinoe australis]
MTITLFFLQASRCIRTAWQLEELGLDYEVEFSERVNKVAPPEFKKKAGDLGKFPTLVDNGLSIYESGAIAEYLEEKYDKSNKLLPKDDEQRYKALRWVHAAEATYALHALPVLYVRWFSGDHTEAQQMIEGRMAANIQKDLDLLESELSKSKGKFLLGDSVSVADCMMQFSASFILARELGTEGKQWPKIKEWMAACENTDTYKAAVKKTGYDLDAAGYDLKAEK